MKRGQVPCEEDVRLHQKGDEKGVDSIWEDVYHTGRVALVRLGDWGRAALITT